MLPIICEGRGLIPRGHGLAPKKDPFPASPSLIAIILTNPGLLPIFVDPDTKRKTPLNRNNYQRIYKAYEDRVRGKKPVVVEEEPKEVEVQKPPVIQPPPPPPPITPPVVQQTPPVQPVIEPKEEEKKEEEKEEEKVEEKKDDPEFVMDPVIKESEPSVTQGDNKPPANNNNNQRPQQHTSNQRKN